MSKNDGVRQFVVDEDDDGIRLDRWFKRHLPDTSFNMVSRWARTGQLRVDGGRANPGDRLQEGQVIRVPPPESAAARGPKPKVKVDLSEDEIAFVKEMVIAKFPDAYLINKPPGLATQGGTKTSQHLDRLLHGLDEDDQGKPKLVHRLDKDTSGVLLVARSARAAGHFSKAFSGRTVRKVYWALVIGVPEVKEGLIDLPLAKQPGTGGEKMHVDMEEGAPAKTRIRVIDRAGTRAAWVELQPLTGRTHQLRAHMAAVGHPIVGDAKYGGAESFLTGGISRKLHLHARRLKIGAPGGKTIDRKAELPPHFAESLATLGFEEMDGDSLPLTSPDPAQSPEAKAKRKAAHAKAFRKARKGERRNRGEPARGRAKPGPTKGRGRKAPPRGKGGKPRRPGKR
ncbi:RluA family pseudouridine synthase [Sphingomicrobium lutaoense]|uniref:23S rRNA pseudouridine955/2504/2580 synthase n=1 Tax=Sphingomicrobium lutaoense TaxID=515949 RepID=A0A839YXQ5_9SPHN|nr:RluA family pseudouridine synthase [Sphingomicrobium lutaoense]MBB3763088.1 23S rRNA pseudouridine955/2504/2580 synthase [Sphingomicrobium lutaoense]